MLRIMSPRSKVSRTSIWAGSFLILALLTSFSLPFGVLAHGGVDDEPKPATAPKTGGQPTVTAVTAERNVQNDSGNFNLFLKRSPGDPRGGETELFVVRIAEKVEGGFGGAGPVPVEKANVTAKVTKADGTLVADNLGVMAEASGNYRTSYNFGSAGDYKIVFNVTTEDGRNFSTDFPVTVIAGPVRTSFWVGLVVLGLLTIGALGLVLVAIAHAVVAQDVAVVPQLLDEGGGVH